MEKEFSEEFLHDLADLMDYCKDNKEENKFILVKDKQLKKELYRFCCEHEDRVFQGEKER